jgi:hypothetical protein
VKLAVREPETTALEHAVVDGDGLFTSDIGAVELTRALDALHIATAASLGLPDLDFVTYHDRQVDAARARGLRVVQPGR